MSDELGKGWFRHDFAFGKEAEDLNGHVNNIEYVRMMQDVAILHVEALGVGMDKRLMVGAHAGVADELFTRCAVGLVTPVGVVVVGSGPVVNLLHHR